MCSIQPVLGNLIYVVGRTRGQALRGLTRILALAFLAFMVFGLAPRARAQAVVAGYRDFSFGSSPTAPTSDKPQHKLWWNDGQWWGVLYNPSASAYSIYRFNSANQSWVATGTVVDTRADVHMDTLWDGAFLYVVSGGTASPARLYRFAYNTSLDSYALSSGFPVTVRDEGEETISLAKDSTGQLWVAYERSNRIWVNRSVGSDNTWGQPFILPVAGTNVASDDIAAIIAFQGDKIGVLWSNQVDRRFYFAVHRDSDVDGTWQTSRTALPGPGQSTNLPWADDHISLKTVGGAADGRVYAAIKTGLDSVSSAGPQAPLVMLLVREPDGTWNSHPFGQVQDNHTRPIVVVDDEHRIAYMLATAPVGGGTIYMKSTSLDSIAFPLGRGTPVIRSNTDTRVNDVTSMRQNLNDATGLLALAGDDTTNYYLHAHLSLSSGGPSPVAPSGLTATAASTSSIQLAWSDNANNEDGYRIEISTNGTTFTHVTDIGANSTGFLSGGLAAQTTYYYRVRAFNDAGDSAYSNIAGATTLSGTEPPPAAPSNLAATAVSSSQINLAWTDNATTETGFEIDRSVEGGDFTPLATVPAGTVVHQDTLLAADTTYSYRVRAINAGGKSAYSNTATATTGAAPPSSTITAIADTFVNDGSLASTNYGTSTTLLVKSATVAGYNRDSYFKFNTPAAVQPSGARLRVFGNLSTATTLDAYVYAVPNTSWTENGMTWNNRPPLGAALANIVFSGTTNLWYEADVTSFVLAEKAAGRHTMSLAMHSLVTNSSANIRLFSREKGAGAPELVLFFSPPPPGPTNLTADATSGSQISLEWEDNATSELGYDIERSTNGVNFAPIQSVGADVTSYLDGGLLPTTTYYYRVRSRNDGGFSAYSNTASATTLSMPPSAPTNLAATAISHTQIDLSWTDNAGNEDGFAIEESTNGTDFTQIGTVDANVSSTSITGLSEATTYHFRVRAFNGAGDSGYSNTASATTQTTPNQPPAAPSGLQAAAVSPSQIDLTWNDNASNEESFRIERSLNGVTFAPLATIGPESTGYSDTGLDPATTYYYRVLAANVAGASGFSNTASATTTGLPPASPTNLVATVVASDRVDLAWNDNAGTEAGFTVERSTNAVTYEVIATLGPNTTGYQNTSGVSGATTYYYRVQAFNDNGVSGYSNVATATTPPGATPVPNAPTNLAATVGPYDWWRISLTWQDNAIDEVGFALERSLDGVAFETLTTLSANATAYTNTGLSPETDYHYRVRAYNNNGYSAYSNTITATTREKYPDAPTNLVATAVSSSQINLAWADNATNEDGFTVWQSSNGTSFSAIATLAPNATSYSATGLARSRKYYYKVRAFNTGGYKESNTASATTLN